MSFMPIQRPKRSYRFRIPEEANFSPQMHAHIRQHAQAAADRGLDTCEGAANTCFDNSLEFMEKAPTTPVYQKHLGLLSDNRQPMRMAEYDIARPGTKYDPNDREDAETPFPPTPGWASSHNTDYAHAKVLNHTASIVGDHVIDFTYRQFDPNAPFPIIEHKDAYAKRVSATEAELDPMLLMMETENYKKRLSQD